MNMMLSQMDATTRAALPGKLAVLTSYFNPCNYRLRKEHYERFASSLNAQGVDLFTVELAFGDDPFQLAPGPRLSQIRTMHVLWHKERLLNLALEMVPEQYDKIAWVDADLLFENAGWSAQLSNVLEHYPVAQVFDEVVYLNRQGSPMQVRQGVAWAVSQSRQHAANLGRYHPGFGWAARRNVVEEIGLLDNHILGGADSIMVCAMYGWWDHGLVRHYNVALREAMLDWGRRFHWRVQGQVGWLPNRLIHLWHGEHAGRQYMERIGWLKRAQFDPALDIRLDANGTWRWTNSKSWLADRVRRYFFERQEDG